MASKNVTFQDVGWFHALSPSEISEEGGIYAWYYLPSFSAASVDEIGSGEDQAVASEMREWLRSYQRSSKWHTSDLRGKKGHDAQLRLGGTFWHDNTVHESPMENMTMNPDSPEWYNEFIKNVGPSFHTPVYIGKAEAKSGGLKHRINTHISDFQKKEDEIGRIRATTPERLKKMREDIENKATNFGERAALSGMSLKYMWVATFEIDESSRIKAVEGLLNRLTHPPHGAK